MSKRARIDQLNAKYGGISALSPVHVQPSTTLRRSFVSPAIVQEVHQVQPVQFRRSVVAPTQVLREVREEIIPMRATRPIESVMVQPTVVASSTIGRRSYASPGTIISPSNFLQTNVVTQAPTITRRSRVEYQEVHPVHTVTTVSAVPTVHQTVRRTEVYQPPVVTHNQVQDVYVHEEVNLPPPPPIERRRNRTMEVHKTGGCPWWLWLLLGLLLLGTILGLLIGFRDQIFGNSQTTQAGAVAGDSDSSQTTTTDEEKTETKKTTDDKEVAAAEEKPEEPAVQEEAPVVKNIDDNGSSLPLSGINPEVSKDQNIDNKEVVTVTNVRCQNGYFFHNGKCLSCPNGSAWNGNQCIRKVLDKLPDIVTKSEVNTADDYEKVSSRNKFSVSGAWSVLQQGASTATPSTPSTTTTTVKNSESGDQTPNAPEAEAEAAPVETEVKENTTAEEAPETETKTVVTTKTSTNMTSGESEPEVSAEAKPEATTESNISTETQTKPVTTTVTKTETNEVAPTDSTSQPATTETTQAFGDKTKSTEQPSNETSGQQEPAADSEEPSDQEPSPQDEPTHKLYIQKRMLQTHKH